MAKLTRYELDVVAREIQKGIMENRDLAEKISIATARKEFEKNPLIKDAYDVLKQYEQGSKGAVTISVKVNGVPQKPVQSLEEIKSRLILLNINSPSLVVTMRDLVKDLSAEIGV